MCVLRMSHTCLNHFASELFGPHHDKLSAREILPTLATTLFCHHVQQFSVRAFAIAPRNR
jgi:hypothetical protein